MSQMKKVMNVMKTMITENPKYMQTEEENIKSLKSRYDIFIRFESEIDEK